MDTYIHTYTHRHYGNTSKLKTLDTVDAWHCDLCHHLMLYDQCWSVNDSSFIKSTDNIKQTSPYPLCQHMKYENMATW